MPLTDAAYIPPEIADRIEAAGNTLGKGMVQLHDGTEPANSDPRVLVLAQGIYEALTAIAMIVLDESVEEAERLRLMVASRAKPEPEL